MKSKLVGIIAMLLIIAFVTSVSITPAAAVGSWQWATGDVYDYTVDHIDPGFFDYTEGTCYSFKWSDNNRFVIIDDHAGMFVYIYTKVFDGGYAKRIRVEFDRNDFRYYGYPNPTGRGGGISVEVKDYDTGGWNQKDYVDTQYWTGAFTLTSDEYTTSEGYVYAIIRLMCWSNSRIFALHIDQAVIQAKYWDDGH